MVGNNERIIYLPGGFSFIFGRNIVTAKEIDNKLTFEVVKVLPSEIEAKAELDGLKQLTRLGHIHNPVLTKESPSCVTYTVTNPGLFIMPTENLCYLGREQRKEALQKTAELAIAQIFDLARQGRYHTSITTLRHRDNLGYIPELGGEMIGFREEMRRHLNLRMSFGLTDGEHIVALPGNGKHLSHTLFELCLTLSVAGADNGLSIPDTASLLMSVIAKAIKMDSFDKVSEAKERIFDIVRDVMRDYVIHQRETDGLLPWLERNVPIIVPISGLFTPASATSTPAAEPPADVPPAAVPPAAPEPFARPAPSGAEASLMFRASAEPP
jgi:hypothetical protein